MRARTVSRRTGPIQTASHPAKRRPVRLLPPALAVLLVLSGMPAAVLAQSDGKAQYAAEIRRAAARYAEDKKKCAAGDAGGRTQCEQDARDGYDHALNGARTEVRAANAQPMACNDCGSVTAVEVVEKKGEGGWLGMLAGGLAGAFLGSKVGDGAGQKAAIAAGAAGGALAGEKVEERLKSGKTWQVKVQYDNGTGGDYTFDKDPGYAKGDLVRSVKDGIVRQ